MKWPNSSSGSVRKPSFGIAQFSQHQLDRCELDECAGVTSQVLEILGQSAAAVEPGEGSFHHPPSGKNLEAFGGIRPLDDLDRKLRHHLRQGLAKLRPLIAAIGEELLQKRIEAEQGRENQHPAVAVLDIGGVNQDVDQQALGIDQDMSLLAADFLARIIPLGINAAPPFSALFTLWLSMIQAVGLGCRSTCSRH